MTVPERRPRAQIVPSAMTLAVLLLALASPTRGGGGATVGEDGSVYGRPATATRLTVHGSVGRGGAQLDIAIVASASAGVGDPWFTDPRDRLVASGGFASVTVFDAGKVTPTLDDLVTFDAVVVWSNFAFADPILLGDTLVDYVNGGGGVVVAVFANTSDTPGRALDGRWLTHGYEIIPSIGGTTTGSAGLGSVLVPDHPLVSGIASFSGGTSSFRPTQKEVVSPSTVIAEWNDGATLVAVREDTVGSRVDLGFYPPSDTVLGNFWDSTTDGDILLVDALLYAAQRPPLIPGDSDGDADVDTDDLAKFELCFTGADLGLVTAGCATFDFDGDDDIDCSDWVAFTNAWTVMGEPLQFAPCTDVNPPLAAGPPHDIPKNRFLSFSPNNPTTPVAIRVELLDLTCTMTAIRCTSDPDCAEGQGCISQGPPILMGWVGVPFDPATAQTPPNTFTALVQADPVIRVWPEMVIHLGDCEIAPVHAYQLSATPDPAAGLFSGPTRIDTIAKPEGKFWADVVGEFDGTEWTPPNRIVNVNDVLAWIRFITFRPAPHITVLDLAGEVPLFVINATDLQAVLSGFQSNPYPPLSFPTQGGPLDCP